MGTTITGSLVKPVSLQPPRYARLPPQEGPPDKAPAKKPVDVFETAPQTKSTPIPTNGKTDALYQVGPPRRPPIQHDNGFLQNPKDPKDPTPVATRAPSLSDHAALVACKVALREARALPGLKDATDAYSHFLYGGGKSRTLSYERFVTNDEAGKTVLKSATQDTQKAAEAQYAQRVARDPSLKGKPVTFDVTGSGVPVGGNNGRYPYPDTQNWQKAIGGHTLWNSAQVTVTPPGTPGGKPTFSMKLTVHAEDRYNFNPGQADIATGIPDDVNGRFEQTGLAHQYTQTGTVRRDVSWPQGDIQQAISKNPDPTHGR